MTAVNAPDPGPERLPFRQRHWLLFVLGVAAAVLVLAAGLALVLPAGIRVPPDHSPAAGRDEALARFDALLAREDADPSLRDDCHSRLVEPDAAGTGTGTGTVVLLLHGYTNCPKQFDRFAAELAAQGYTVLSPRAPFHGEDPGAHSPLGSLGADDLRAFADETVDIATGLGDRLVVLGLSGGGTLTSYVAQYRSEVDLAIAVAAFLGTQAIPGPLVPPLVNVSAVLPVIDMRDPPPDAELRGAYPHGFSDTSLQGAAAYMRLGHQVMQDAATTRPAAARIIAVINDADDQVNNPMIEDLATRWAAASPGAVEVVHLDASLGLLHDLITPDRKGAKPEVAYPRLLELVGRP